MINVRTEESPNARFHENPLTTLTLDFSSGMVLGKKCRWLTDRASEGP